MLQNDANPNEMAYMHKFDRIGDRDRMILYSAGYEVKDSVGYKLGRVRSNYIISSLIMIRCLATICLQHPINFTACQNRLLQNNK